MTRLTLAALSLLLALPGSAQVYFGSGGPSGSSAFVDGQSIQGGSLIFGPIRSTSTLAVDGTATFGGSVTVRASLLVNTTASIGSDVAVERARQSSDYLLIGNPANGGGNRSTIRYTGAGYNSSPSAANAESDGDRLVFYNGAGGKAAIGLGSSYDTWIQATGGGVGGLGGRIHFWTGTDVTPVHAMSINNAQNVGIGTASPASKLEVAGGSVTITGSGARLGVGAREVAAGRAVQASDYLLIGSQTSGDAARGAIRFANSGYALPSNENTDSDGDKIVIWNTATDKTAIGMDSRAALWFESTGQVDGTSGFVFYGGTDGTANEHMRLNGYGNLGLGTSAPGSKFHVQAGSITSQGAGAGIRVWKSDAPDNIPAAGFYRGGLTSANYYDGVMMGQGLANDDLNLSVWGVAGDAMYLESIRYGVGPYAMKLNASVGGNVLISHASSKLGVGTGSPGAKLHVSSGGIINDGTGNGITVGNGGLTTSGPIFTTGDNFRTDYSAGAYLFGAGAYYGGMRYVSSGKWALYGSNSNLVAWEYSATGSTVSINGNVAVAVSTGLYVTGTLGQTVARSCATGTTTDAAGNFDGCVASDRSLKTSISALKYNPKAIDSLRPVSYKWKKETNRDRAAHIGFIAQEVNEVSPEAVIPAGVGLSGIDPNAVLALVVKELQQSRKRLEALEKK